MTDPKYIAERDKMASEWQSNKMKPEPDPMNGHSYCMRDFIGGYDAGYSRANSELRLSNTIIEQLQRGHKAYDEIQEAKIKKLRQALDVAVELSDALDDYFKKSEDGEWKTAWTQVEKARVKFRSFLTKIKTLIGETGDHE